MAALRRDGSAEAGQAAAARGMGTSEAGGGGGPGPAAAREVPSGGASAAGAAGAGCAPRRYSCMSAGLLMNWKEKERILRDRRQLLTGKGG